MLKTRTRLVRCNWSEWQSKLEPKNELIPPHLCSDQTAEASFKAPCPFTKHKSVRMILHLKQILMAQILLLYINHQGTDIATRHIASLAIVYCKSNTDLMNNSEQPTESNKTINLLIQPNIINQTRK